MACKNPEGILGNGPKLVGQKGEAYVQQPFFTESMLVREWPFNTGVGEGCLHEYLGA